MSGHNISGGNLDAQYTNVPNQTTMEGAQLVNNALGERVRFAKPTTFTEPTAYDDSTEGKAAKERRTNDMLRYGLNANMPDPAKYVLPSGAKDAYTMRQDIIDQHALKDNRANKGIKGNYEVGTQEEVQLAMELQAQKRIMEYDKYCAAMFNYKHIPGGLKAMEEINPGFTSRRVAQVYSDAAYAAKNKAIEVLGQANCGHEANMFKFDVDNGVIQGPVLEDPTLSTATTTGMGYVSGGFANMFKKQVTGTNLPGFGNQNNAPVGNVAFKSGSNNTDGFDGTFNPAKFAGKT